MQQSNAYLGDMEASSDDGNTLPREVSGISDIDAMKKFGDSSIFQSNVSLGPPSSAPATNQLGETGKLINEVRAARHQLANSVYGLNKAKEASKDPGDALPLIVGGRGMNKSQQDPEPIPFRFAGFGKYRNNNSKNRTIDASDDGGNDTDGQWDSGVDGDGHGGNRKDGRRRCKHRSITNWECTTCGYKMTRFGSFFDSGRIPGYLRLMQMSDAEDQIKSLDQNIDVIYESYAPTNIIQMRDHMQTVIGRSLIGYIKDKALAHAYRALPTEAVYSDVLKHVKNYQQYRTDFKEQKANVMKSNALFIDSHFESGNLEKVFKNRHKESQEYHLFMNVDTNTVGHQQWFYFRVRNMKRDVKYKFNIWNFTKPKSLYKEGMVPMWRSKKKCKIMGLDSVDGEDDGWEFIPGENLSEVSYTRSQCQRSKERRHALGAFAKLFEEDAKKDAKSAQKPKNKKEKEKTQQEKEAAENTQGNIVPKLENVVYYCLSFTLTFDYNKDTVFIAYSRPYKYTQLILDILKAENALMDQDPDRYSEEKRAEPAKWDGETDIVLNNQIWYTRKLMCLTLSGIPVPILTVTACRNSGKKFAKREGIFLTSRVHPGETNSSFVFMGMFEMLMKTNDPIAQYLRENFVFKMVPCLNPDGVIRGNYRSSFAGVDLNRQWILPSESLHPTIFHCKKQIEKLYKERPVLLYCDLHGHSRKKNSFIYGCNRAANGGFNSWTKVRLLPRILARNNHVFDITTCKFKVEKGKLGTGRVVVWKEYEVTNSFTLENSFHGYDYGDSFKEYSVYDFKKLGADLLASVHQYQQILLEIQKELAITRGWLKPKRLLEVTGQTAQEKLKQEARDKKFPKRARTQAIAEENQGFNQAQAKKPPRGPVVKSRGGPVITLQGLIDQYVKNKQTGQKDQQQEESSKQSSAQVSGRGGNNIETKSRDSTPNPKVLRNQAQKVTSLSSKTIGHSSQKSGSAEKKAESSGAGGGQEQKRLRKSKSPNQNQQKDDVGQLDDPSQLSKEGKIVTASIVKIQSFIRMIIQRAKYLEMQVRQQEDELQQLLEEDSSPTQEPGSGLMKTPAGQSSQHNRMRMRKDSETGDDQIIPRNNDQLSPEKGLGGHEGCLPNQMHDKYMNQLTLEMIESESLIQVKQKARAAKPGTAGAGNSRLSTVALGTSTPINEHESEVLEETLTADREHESETGRDPEADRLQASDESSRHDWRQFFTIEELTEAFEKIQKGEDPTDEEMKSRRGDGENESVDNGSESCPSDDNLDLRELYSIIYCDKNKSAEKIEAKLDVEAQYEKDFANFVKKIQKRYRDASKDSATSGDPNHNRHLHKDGAPCDRCRDRSREINRETAKRLSGMLHLDSSLGREEGDQKAKKGKVNLIITGKGQNPDQVDEDKDGKSGAKRKGKVFVIGGAKRASAVGLSPNADKSQLKVGVRVVGISGALKKAMNIKDRRLRSQEANQNNSADGLREGTNPQSKQQSGNSASRIPAGGADRAAKVPGIQITNKQNAFLPVLAGKLGSTCRERNAEDGLEVLPQEVGSDLQPSDSYTISTLTTPGVGPSAATGGVGASTIYGSIAHNTTADLYSSGFGAPDVGREEPNGGRPSHIHGQLAQTQSESFNHRQQMMQLGVPGQSSSHAGSSNGGQGHLALPPGTMRSPAPQRHSAVGIVYQEQRQSVINFAGMNSNGIQREAGPLQRSYQTTYGPPGSTQLNQTSPFRQLVKAEYSDVTHQGRPDRRLPPARSPATGGAMGARQVGVAGLQHSSTFATPQHSAKRSPAALAATAGGSRGGLGIDQDNTNVPQGSRSPGPTGLMGGQTVGLLNQKTMALRQAAGAGPAGGGISGLSMDLKMTQPVEIIQGLKSPQAPKQNPGRRQSFGLQSLLPAPQGLQLNDGGQVNQQQPADNQPLNYSLQTKMNLLRSPRRQINLNAGGTAGASPTMGNHHSQRIVFTNHDRNKAALNRQQYADHIQPGEERRLDLRDQDDFDGQQSLRVNPSNQSQQLPNTQRKLRSPAPMPLKAGARPALEANPSLPSHIGQQRQVPQVHISINSLQSCVQGRPIAGMTNQGNFLSNSPARSLAQNAGQAQNTNTQAMLQGHQRRAAYLSPNPANVSSKDPHLQLPPAGKMGPSQNNQPANKGSPVGFAAFQGQSQNCASSGSKGFVRIRKAHISPNPSDNHQKLTIPHPQPQLQSYQSQQISQQQAQQILSNMITPKSNSMHRVQNPKQDENYNMANKYQTQQSKDKGYLDV